MNVPFIAILMKSEQKIENIYIFCCVRRMYGFLIPLGLFKLTSDWLILKSVFSIF